MQISQTDVFEKDILHLGNDLRLRLKKAIEKISLNPTLGKPLRHFSNVFSERIENKRLIYQLRKNDVLLVCFKNRDEVYDYVNSLL